VKRLKKRLAAEPRPRAVVMLGSSRTVFAFRGQVVEQARAAEGAEPVVVFNFGLPGAGPLTGLVTLRRLVAEGLGPDVLLVEVLPPVLAGQVPLAEVNRLGAERLWTEDLPLVERYLPSDGRRRAEWWIGWPFPSASHRFALVSRAAPALLPYEARL